MGLSSILSFANLICYVSSHFETIPGEWAVDVVVGDCGNKASSIKLKLGAETELASVLSSSRIVSYYWC